METFRGGGGGAAENVLSEWKNSGKHLFYPCHIFQSQLFFTDDKQLNPFS
jgi:hypothetical protein